MSAVWAITDAEGDLSFVRHGQRGEEALVGPFFYTRQDDAARTAYTGVILPAGENMALSFTKVDPEDVITWVLDGFPPVNTDVFAIDEGMFPITERGAQWVDQAIGEPTWGPLFDENGTGSGLTWLDQVIKQVANRLHLDPDDVADFMDSLVDRQDRDLQVKSAKQKVMDHVNVAILPEHGTISLRQHAGIHDLAPSTEFWLRTHGMDFFKKPELEFRHVPAQWVSSAAADLAAWAAYCIDNEVAVGSELPSGGPVLVFHEVDFSDDPFWDQSPYGCYRLGVSRIQFMDGDAKPH